MSDLFLNISTAGISAVSTVIIVHPIDTIKTSLQIIEKNAQNKSISQTIKNIYSTNGLKSFWRGIGPAIMRESTYTSLRLGLYGPIKKIFNVNSESNFIFKFMSGSLSGLIGSIAGNPFDVLKTKMIGSLNHKILSTQSIQSTESIQLTQSTKSLVKEIYQHDGLKGFYKGVSANIMRACVLNGTKMACYDQIKEEIIKLNIIKNNLLIQFMSAFSAGFFMSITVTPFDMVRTKLMNQPIDQKIYNGFIDCVCKITKQNGPMALYTGFIPIWARFAPTTTLQLVIFDQLKPLFSSK